MKLSCKVTGMGSGLTVLVVVGGGLLVKYLDGVEMYRVNTRHDWFNRIYIFIRQLVRCYWVVI